MAYGDDLNQILPQTVDNRERESVHMAVTNTRFDFAPLFRMPANTRKGRFDFCQKIAAQPGLAGLIPFCGLLHLGARPGMKLWFHLRGCFNFLRASRIA